MKNKITQSTTIALLATIFCLQSFAQLVEKNNTIMEEKEKKMVISLGNDHAGFSMKEEVLAILKELGVEVIDHGCHSYDPVDFPDIAKNVCNSVRSGEADRGIMICGTGVGASIAANKFPGIRAATIHDVHCAHQGVEHDDMNVLTMGAQIVGPWLAEDIIRAFVEAEFLDEERYRRRIGKLRDLELDAALELQDELKKN